LLKKLETPISHFQAKQYAQAQLLSKNTCVTMYLYDLEREKGLARGGYGGGEIGQVHAF